MVIEALQSLLQHENRSHRPHRLRRTKPREGRSSTAAVRLREGIRGMDPAKDRRGEKTNALIAETRKPSLAISRPRSSRSPSTLFIGIPGAPQYFQSQRRIG